VSTAMTYLIIHFALNAQHSMCARSACRASVSLIRQKRVAVNASTAQIHTA
jgi:hypothetical protein